MATSLTPDEVTEFLETERTLILASVKKSGSPVMHALWFTYLDGAVYFNIHGDSFKYKNIQRDNRVCCMVEAGETYLELRGVMIEGRVVLVEDEDELARVQVASDRKGERIGSGMEEMPAYFSKSRQGRLERRERIMLKVPLDKVRTWNFAQVREYYEKAESRAR